MNVRLVIDCGSERKIVPIRQEEAILGRAHGNTVRIPSSEVSRQHCRLTQQDGVVLVRDLGSVNGTFLNGQRIRTDEIVRPGDTIDVGPVTFIVEYELSPEALEQLRGVPDEVEGGDFLTALADGEILEVEPGEELEDDGGLALFEEVVEEPEAEPLPIVEPPKKKKPPKPHPLDDTPTKVADELEPLSPDFNFDAGGWALPAGGDLRELMDDGFEEEEKPAPKKPKPKKK